MNPDRAGSAGPTRTVFFGSGAFAEPILEALVAVSEIELVGVVAAPDRPTGRQGQPTPVPVARRARELDLPLLQPARLRTAEGVAGVAAFRPAFGVLADYGQIVPRSVLDLPASGILNIHPSALPRHRGATPIAATILAGDPEAAVSLIRMDEGLDTGPIVAQERWALDGSETAETLRAEAARRGARLLQETVGPWLAGRLRETAQRETDATLTRALAREHGRLDPARPAVDLERQVRAYVPWPGTFVDTPLGRLIVHRGDVRPSVPGDVPGTLVADGEGLALATVDGRLRIRDAQLAGRRAMDTGALLRGAPGLVGQTVGLR